MATPDFLEYGTAVRANRRRCVRWSLVVVLLVVVVWQLHSACQWAYYRDRDRVRADWDAVSSGRTMAIDGYDNTMSWAVAEARIRADGSQGRIIRILSPRPGELRTGARLAIESLGSTGVCVETGDERVSVGYLDVGSQSEFAPVLPFRLKNGADLALHYDEILSFIKQENSGTYTNRQGRLCTYRIRVYDSSASPIPPALGSVLKGSTGP